MATEVEAARLLVYQAAWLADQGSARFTRESSMAKLFASEVAVRVANECVQIHGGRSEEHTSELQSRQYLVCRLLLEKKKSVNDSTENSLHTNICNRTFRYRLCSAE